MRHTATSKRSRDGMVRMELEVAHGHAQCLEHLKLALQNACDYTGLPHNVGSWKGGSNSNYVTFLVDKGTATITFFFKGIPNKKNPRIEVRWRPRGPVIATIKNIGQAYRFINKYTK